jgi:hypothetical protein
MRLNMRIGSDWRVDERLGKLVDYEKARIRCRLDLRQAFW